METAALFIVKIGGVCFILAVAAVSIVAALVMIVFDGFARLIHFVVKSPFGKSGGVLALIFGAVILARPPRGVHP